MLKFSLLFAIPSFLCSMIFPMFPGFDDAFRSELIPGCAWRDAILFLLSTPIQFGSPGLMFYKNAYRSLKAGKGNMDVLVALATSCSYFFSLFAVIICVGSQGMFFCLFFTLVFLLYLCVCVCIL